MFTPLLQCAFFGNIMVKENINLHYIKSDKVINILLALREQELELI